MSKRERARSSRPAGGEFECIRVAPAAAVRLLLRVRRAQRQTRTAGIRTRPEDKN